MRKADKTPDGCDTLRYSSLSLYSFRWRLGLPNGFVVLLLSFQLHVCVYAEWIEERYLTNLSASETASVFRKVSVCSQHPTPDDTMRARTQSIKREPR